MDKKLRALYYSILIKWPEDDDDAINELLDAQSHLTVELKKHFDDITEKEIITEMTKRVLNPDRKSLASIAEQMDNDVQWDHEMRNMMHGG